MIRHFVCFALALLAACSASGPTFVQEKIPEGSSIIYFYRPNTAMLSVATYYSIDGVQVAKLNRNGYTKHFVKPGKHVVKMSWDCSLGACLGSASFKEQPEITIDIKPNKAKYFKLVIDGAFLGKEIQWGFVEANEKLALGEISENKYQGR